MQDSTQPYRPPQAPVVETTALSSAGLGCSEVLPGNRYRVVEEIARGGMGIVLRAVDLQLDRPLAIKVLMRPDANGHLARRFLEESRITGQLQHPGVAPVHEIGWLADGRPFFSMKLIEGKTLAELLSKRASMQENLPRFLKVFEQVAQTLAYAHSRGVIHRDLKPSNVMVGAFGEVQVMDWGLAKRLHRVERDVESGVSTAEESPTVEWSPPPHPATDDSDDWMTQYGQVIGTPAYMPPEQARGDIALPDKRSDVFGLGAVLCEILTGLPPFSGERKAAMEAARRGDLSAANSRLDTCHTDAELVMLARRCLCVEVALRPLDAAEVAAQIAGYLQSVEERLQQAELKHAALQVTAERRRRRLTAALAGTAVALILLLASGAFWMQWQSRKNERIQRESETRSVVELALFKAEGATEEAAQMPQRDSVSAAAAVAVWRQAMAGVEEAQAALRSGGGSDGWDTARLDGVRNKVTQGLADSERAHEQFRKEETFLQRIDAARLARATWIGDRFDYVGSARKYGEAFADFGLAISADIVPDPKTFADAVKPLTPSVRDAIVVALDDWAAVAGLVEDSPSAADLRGLANAVDDLPWRNRLRVAAEKKDVPALKQLVAEANQAAVPASTLLLLADNLRIRQERAASLAILRMAREAHPDDFWTHFGLGLALDEDRSSPTVREEQFGAYRAALAIRPNAAAAYNNLGNAYLRENRVTEATTCFERAIAADREFAVGYVGLAHAWESRDLDKTISLLQTAIAKFPKAGMAHNNLASAYSQRGKSELAIAHYRRAIECEPNLFLAHQNLGIELCQGGQLEKGRLHLAKAACLNPKANAPQFALALLNLNRGELEEGARRARLAVAASPEHAGTHDVLGELQYTSGDFNGAVNSLRQALNLDTKDPQPQGDKWRQQVEAKLALCQRYQLLAKSLPEFLAGKRQPKNAAEFLELASVCGYRRLYAAAARQFAQAFALEPTLLLSAAVDHAYHAASAAALALEGRADGEPALTELEREELRRLALSWLSAELQAHRKALQDKSTQAADSPSILRHRLTDSTLRAVRESELRGSLPPDEQQAWQSYWSSVEEMSAGAPESTGWKADRASILLPRQSKWFPRPPKPIELSPLELPTATNSLRMRLVQIPAGTFTMGSTPSDGDRADEIPHEVRITQPFWMSAHEVTVAQYRQFVIASKQAMPPTPDRRNTWGFSEHGKFVADRDFTWLSPGFSQKDDHPVCCVNWINAAAFCKWLSEKEERVYRLPTEAEWEYACRAGTRYRFLDEHGIQNVTAAGNVSDAAARKKFPGWLSFAPGDDGYVFTSPVGSFAPNRFGLYDMVGNVTEFCGDWYDGNACLVCPAVDPRGPTTATHRVARGAAYNERSRISNRFLLRPERCQNNLGFRVVCEVPGAQ